MKSKPRPKQFNLYDSAITQSFSQDAGLNEVVPLLVTIGTALHELGQPAHKVEASLMKVAERFQVPLQTFVVPTGQFLSVHRPEGPITFVLRMKPGIVDLDRLSQVMRVVDGLIDGSITALAGKAKIDKIMQSGVPRGALATVAAYTLSAAPFSVFFGGGWQELIVSTCVGLAVGTIAFLMERYRRVGRPFELVAAAAAAFIAGSADEIFGAYGGWIPLAAGLVVLLPGISLVDALEELASGQLTAGASRLASVGVVFLSLTLGAVTGYQLAEIWPKIRDVEPHHLPEWLCCRRYWPWPLARHCGFARARATTG